MLDLDYRVQAAEYCVRRAILTVRSKLDSLEHAVNNGTVLNDMGELQALGPQLDAAVAVLATLRSIKVGEGEQ